MDVLSGIARRVRAAAPHSEPITSIERRVIVAVVLLLLLGTWGMIWTVHHVEARREHRFFKSTNIRVSLEQRPLQAV